MLLHVYCACFAASQLVSMSAVLSLTQAVGVQLNFSKCVPLTPSNSSLQDKRAYHKMVLGERQLKNSTPLKKLQ